MSQFEKTNSKAAHIIMMRSIRSLFQKLNPKQQDEANKALNDLIEKDYISYEDGKGGPECIRLNELGFSILYSNSKSESEISKLIMHEFEKQKSRVGDIVMMKNLNFNLVQRLNPLEMNLFEPALNF
jgi:uncharacterized protein (UPF0262 family)